VKHADPACGGGIDGNDAPVVGTVVVGTVRGIVWPCGREKEGYGRSLTGLESNFLR
jgi:hypothetical protein